MGGGKLVGTVAKNASKQNDNIRKSVLQNIMKYKTTTHRRLLRITY